jgi:Uma2 family endonuclease
MATAENREIPPMTEAEYLAFADEQDIKYEYANGEVLAMAGASMNHNTIAGNTIFTLRGQLRGKGCVVHPSDTRVHIASKNTYRYPDVTVFCGDSVYVEGRTDTITNPVLLVEVMSPGTAFKDHNVKLAEYIDIETLEAYVLIAQDEPHVQVYRRQAAGKWLYEQVMGMDTELEAHVGDHVIRPPLAEIYLDVRWDDAKQ